MEPTFATIASCLARTVHNKQKQGLSLERFIGMRHISRVAEVISRLSFHIVIHWSELHPSDAHEGMFDCPARVWLGSAD